MSDLEYEIHQKKNIAHSAKKKVKKNRGCTLTQDHMTKKQLEDKNGPLHTYNLHGPMSYKEFRGMPLDLQCEYIAYLRKAFEVSDTCIGEMLGCSGSNIFKFRREHGIDMGNKLFTTTEQRSRWREFCSGKNLNVEGGNGSDNDTVTNPAIVPEEEAIATVSAVVPATQSIPEGKTAATVKFTGKSAMRHFSADLTIGCWEELYAVLKNLPVPGHDFNVHIDVDITGEEM